jgi:23S rRNA pseudouridine2605 synthase
MQERLQKIIARAGVTSRRKAEALILARRVKVNGRTVEKLGEKADAASDKIVVDGRPLRPQGRRIVLLLNKPVGVVSTVSDPERRPTVMSLVRGIRERVYPVGRLDYHSSGLLLMTNDGELANHLMARASEVPRTYQVKLNEDPQPEKLALLERGIPLDGRRTAPARIRKLSRRPPKVRGPAPRVQSGRPWYEVTLVEGRYHQVRRMFERIGHPVLKLKRVRIAFLTDEGLPLGRFRQLTSGEIERLKKWKG